MAAECDDEFVRARCLSIVRSAERMLRTTSSVLHVADSSCVEDARLFNPVEVVEDVLADYRALNVPIRVEVHEANGMVVHAVPEQLEALLCSFLGNAGDHGASDSDILVCVRKTDRNCEIVIVNSVEERSRHFGLGLGSYIGQQLASQLSARMSVERDEQNFIVRLLIPLED
jgi:signal transduction histidine kinase